MLTCYNDAYSVTPLVEIRCKLALVNRFFCFSDFLYYQGGLFTSTDVKTCFVAISVKYYSITTNCRSNTTEAAISQSYRKCS